MISYNEMNNTTCALQNLNYKNCTRLGNTYFYTDDLH